MVSEQVDWATQRELIRTLVKQVEIEQGQVNIVFRVGPNPSTPDPGKDFLQHCKGRDFPVTGKYRPTRDGESDNTAFPKRNVRKKGKYVGVISAAHLIRYADDFVIIHDDITVVIRCREIVSEWLQDMGLELKPSKTRLTHTLDKYEDEEPGFNFLGFNIRQFKVGKYNSKQGFKTIITPSKEKQRIHYERVASIINDHKAAPQMGLINHLNPVIRGWSNYYLAVISKATYSRLDYLMYSKLEAWAKHRHPNKSKKWIAKKYWQSIGGNNWVFATKQDGKNPMRLLTHDETPIVRYAKVKGEASPYDGNLIYWSSRMGSHPEATKRVATLLKKLHGKCNHCGLYFRESDVLEIDHIIPLTMGGKDKYENLQILHKHCHDTKTAKDGSVVGTHDKRQIIEEPDEVKISRPVLKTSGSRERTA